MKQFVPLRFRPSLARLYYSFYRAQVRFRCWAADVASSLSGHKTLPPAVLRFRIGESISTKEFNRIGSGCAQLIREVLEASDVEFQASDAVLDFGCGCGRTLRWFLKANVSSTFYGVDIDGEAIAWCSRHLPLGTFAVNSYLPPLAFPAGMFDIIYAVSVFTHLDETIRTNGSPSCIVS